MENREEQKVIIAGTGIMGASIAQVYAQNGYNVTLYDISDEAIRRGKDLITINQEIMVKEGMLTEEESKKLVERLTYTRDKMCFKDAFLVVETIVEKLEIKRKFWSEISIITPDDAILATNTSGLRITDIAKAVYKSERFAGLHWLNPPHLIPLVEVIKGDDTSDETIQKLVELTEGINKKPVVINKDINGFIINRMQFSILREALHIVKSGAATIEDIDNVFKYGLGMRYACLGPFETADLGGLDTFNLISSYLFADLSDEKNGSEELRKLVCEGSLGVKSGKGFYDYSNGRGEEVIKKRDSDFIKLARCLYEK